MGEVLRPTPEQAEDAIAAALARPNPIDDSHEAAREVEEFINDYYHETEDSEETQREYLTKTIRELDQNCGHVGEEIIS